MGIPHLASTLEPYATFSHLRDHKSFVVDGPSLAWHILYQCLRNDVHHPSYELLGVTAIAWLDELTKHGSPVAAIYFDGHLPLAKRPTRMGRMIKHLRDLQYTNSDYRDERLYLGSLAARYEMVGDVFTIPQSGSAKGRRPLAPPFHVPAIIEALKASSRYGAAVNLVPGEADGYCAEHVRQHGGTVLTSDSDLLVHNLGHGCVMFFRSISKDDDSPMSETYCPKEIACKLGLSEDLSRFAYERLMDAHASVRPLILRCLGPVKHETSYKEFCQAYLDHETSPLPMSATGQTISINSLDPRVSELILQLGNPNQQADDPDANQMFLPILIEDTGRGSAWEQSTPIRQLAYTIARWYIPGTTSFVREFRRVSEPLQKGRSVPLLSTSSAKALIDELVALMFQLEEDTDDDPSFRWLVYSLILDMRECYEQGKSSLVLHTIKQALDRPIKPQSGSKKIPWDIIHFLAQAQAGYYSLRMLKQVFSLVPEARTQEATPDLCQMLDSLPPLAKAPGMQNTIEFLEKASQTRLLSLVSNYVVLPEDFSREPVKGPDQAASAEKRNKKTKKRKAKDISTPARSNDRGNPASRNPFDVLIQDM